MTLMIFLMDMGKSTSLKYPPMKEQIAQKAWDMVMHFPSLKKLNFFPSFIGMLWLFLVLIYQISFTYVIVFKQKDKFFQMLSDFMHKDYFFEVLVSF